MPIAIIGGSGGRPSAGPLRAGGDLIRRASEAHVALEAVHPFADGNGRVGRLLLVWQLLAAGLPAPRFRLADRGRYLAAVARHDTRALASLVRGWLPRVGAGEGRAATSER